MTSKMVMAVVARDQADRVLDKLISAGYGATFTESRGGMLRQAQKMLFIAVNADKVDDVLDIIRRMCRTRVEVSEQRGPAEIFGPLAPATSTTEVGYAVAFVWDLDRFEAY